MKCGGRERAVEARADFRVLPRVIAQVDWWSIFQGNQLIIRRYTKVIRIHNNTTVFLPDWDPVDARSWKKMMLPCLKNPWTVDTLVFLTHRAGRTRVMRWTNARSS